MDRRMFLGAAAALQASFPAEFEFSAVAGPTRNHDVGRLFWRLGPAGSAPVVKGMDVAQRCTAFYLAGQLQIFPYRYQGFA
jgi:hypothetical protein